MRETGVLRTTIKGQSSSSSYVCAVRALSCTFVEKGCALQRFLHGASSSAASEAEEVGFARLGGLVAVLRGHFWLLRTGREAHRGRGRQRVAGTGLWGWGAETGSTPMTEDVA